MDWLQFVDSESRAGAAPLNARDGIRYFPTGELTLPKRGLKYGFQGTVNAKNLRKLPPSDGRGRG